MTPDPSPPDAADPHWAALLVIVGAAVIAFASAGTSAGSLNDGSRLATVQALVEDHTLAIDHSMYAGGWDVAMRPGPAPYIRNPPSLNQKGTADKIFVNGHYYSDKPPVPAVLLAGWYQVLRWTTGLQASERPDRFYYWITMASSGLAYVVAVWSIYRIGRRVGLPLGLRLALAASFGLSTLALPYMEQVNSHIWLLGVAALLMLGLTRLAADGQSFGMLIGLGSLAGLGYSIEAASGPLLLAAAGILVTYRCRRLAPVATFALAALPWVILHHALNYHITGTFKPAGAVPELFAWPGSEWTKENLTGFWNHSSLADFINYAGLMLVDQRGFLCHNLPLYLAVAAYPILIWRRPSERPELLFAGAWSVATWLVYAALSTNLGGGCLSVRWLVPLLAPGYYVLAVLLRWYPRWVPDFLLFSVWGAFQVYFMWTLGPWSSDPAYFWEIHEAAFLCWGLLMVGRLLSILPPWPEAVLRWLGLGLVGLLSLLPLVIELKPVSFLNFSPLGPWFGPLSLLTGLVAVIMVRAWADRRWEPWAIFANGGFALLAAGLTAWHWYWVDTVHEDWQRDMYLNILNGTAGPPHQFRFLPYGFTRLFERWCGDWSFACLLYRWFFTYWFIWAWYRYARLAHTPIRALITLSPLPLLYPLSVLYYYGQLTDPLSHCLLVLGLIYAVENEWVPLAAALALGILAKETAVLLIPVYLACHWRTWFAWRNTALLTVLAVGAFLTARLPLGWWPGETINGVDGLMIGANLGVGPQHAITNVPLYENYLHPALFVLPFLPFIAWYWRRCDPRLRAVAATLTPLLLFSNLCYGWMYESRNYVPLLPVLMTLALPTGRTLASAKPYRPQGSG